MRRIRLLRETDIGGVRHGAGAVLDVADSDADRLFRENLAVSVYRRKTAECAMMAPPPPRE